MRIADMNWMQVEAYLRRDDRRRAAGHASSTPSAPHGRLHPAPSGWRRGRRAARRAGVPGGRLRRHALFPGVSRLDLAARRDLPARWSATSSTACAGQRLPPHPDRQRPRRQPARSSSLATSGWPTIGEMQSASSTTGGTRRKTWAKVQAIDPVASHASWMENFPWTRLPGVGPPSQRKPMVDLGTRARCSARPASATISATAISAATTSGRTRRCWRSGRSRSRRHATCSKAGWA